LENFSLGEVNSSTIVSSPEIITSKILPNKTISFSKVLDKYLTLDNNITSKKKIIAAVCKIFIIEVILLSRVKYLSNTLENEIVLLGKILLVMISGLLTIVLLFTSPREKFSKVFLTLVFLTIVLNVISFRVSSLLSFYIYFEISILPVVLLTLDWDYQPGKYFSYFFTSCLDVYLSC
jgi:hypothetical protein